jgi:hypothetical protein
LIILCAPLVHGHRVALAKLGIVGMAGMRMSPAVGMFIH